MSHYKSAQELVDSACICDIIEFNRITYCHYAFYIGNGICVHVQGPSEGTFCSSSPSPSSSSKGASGRKGTKCAMTLVDIADGSGRRIRNCQMMAFQRGVTERRTEDSLKLALSGLPRHPDGSVVLGVPIDEDYSVISDSNCEGWATYWKYDDPTGWSIQARNGIFGSTVGTVGRLSEECVFRLEEKLASSNLDTGKKILCVTGAMTYKTLSYAATGVKETTDFIAGGLTSLLDRL